MTAPFLLALLAPLASAAPPTPPPALPVLPVATAAAPTRAWQGLELGVTGEAALDAWAADRRLTCEKSPSPRRETTHLKCEHPAASAIGEPEQPGRLDLLLLVRTDAGPVHHVSTDRLLPEADAAAAYVAAVERLSATYGKPARSLAPPASFASAVTRVATEWVFTDLTVRVTLIKVGQGPIRLTERWDVPGVEAGVQARPGTVGAHGSAPRARNPHLED